MKIDDKTLKTICKIGKGPNTCKYIVCGADGFECVKGTSLQRPIDSRTDMNAQSNNCPGMVRSN